MICVVLKYGAAHEISMTLANNGKRINFCNPHFENYLMIYIMLRSNLEVTEEFNVNFIIGIFSNLPQFFWKIGNGIKLATQLNLRPIQRCINVGV
jgi:hypothetical protein